MRPRWGLSLSPAQHPLDAERSLCPTRRTRVQWEAWHTQSLWEGTLGGAGF